MAEGDQRKKKIRRDAFVAMAIIFAIVSIWKGFSGIIDLIVLKDNNGAIGYFACIILGLVILAIMHYNVRNFI